MYRVAIVDDEPIITDGLARGVAWEKWNCTVCGTAFDGREGIQLVNEKQPDILITDISMPGVNGLMMIAALKSEHPDMQITILTGYREFDYAQEAIRLGVSRFLLKPSRMNELEEAVEFMTGELQKAGISPDKPREEDGDVLYDTAAGSFIVSNAMNYIREHYADRLRLGDVAEQIFVSQWHLSKLLNKHTGQNFSEILNGIRIAKAKELMMNPALRISDIAEMVGFLDVAHFSRVFKKAEGVSANEYRNAHCGKS
ncbi:MAG: response regulator [Lachnospiraceae bacterium]|nr:response regulator [Lachnospiraceae bacterium]